MTALNRLTAGIQSSTCAYDNLDRLTSITRSSRTVSYTYDAFGGVLTTQPLGTVEYDLAGRRTRMEWSDGVNVTYVWDAASNLTDIRLLSSTSIASFAYDSHSWRTTMWRGASVNVSSYYYDDASLLSLLDLNIVCTTYEQVLYFSRDAGGRMIKRTGPTPSMTGRRPAAGRSPTPQRPEPDDGAGRVDAHPQRPGQLDLGPELEHLRLGCRQPALPTLAL